MNLNPEQQSAVALDAKALLIRAAAGTGKTATMAHRVSRMTEEGISPRTILLLTFTRFAAREMSERLDTLLSKRAHRVLRTGTFHAVCLTILREFGELRGYRENLSIFDEQDRKDVLTEIIKDHGIKSVSVTKAMAFLERAESGESSQPPDAQLLFVALEYTNTLRRFNAVDYSGLMVEAVSLLEDYPRVQEHYSSIWRHVLVDEFQDTSALQVRFLRALHPETLCLIGDYRQSIFGWRGARPEMLLDFSAELSASRIDLLRNYRSLPTIIFLANKIISDPERYGLDMIPTRKSESDEPEVTIRAFPDMVSEGEFVVNQVVDLCDKYHYRDIVVLARTNRALQQFSQWVRDFHGPDFPHIRIGAQADFWNSEEVRLCVQVLKLINNPLDNQSLKSILKTMDMQVPDIKRLEATARKTETPLVKMLPEDHAVRRAFEFCVMESEGKEPLAHMAFLYWWEMLDIPTFYLFRKLTTRAENAMKLRDYCESKNYTLAEFLDWYAAREIQDELQDSEGEDRIRLMTIHSMKGLEAPVVFLLNAAEGQLPSRRGDLEEERRLFYVAATRAKDRLFITCSLTDEMGRPRNPSSFLNGVWANETNGK